MQRFMTRVGIERVMGEHPSALRALAASAIAGTAFAGITYRLLRSDGDDD